MFQLLQKSFKCSNIMINQNCDFCQCKSRYFALSFTPKCHLFIQCAFANKISQILLLNLPADFTEAGASKKSAPFQACLVNRVLLGQKNALQEVVLNFVQYLLWSGPDPSQINRRVYGLRWEIQNS